MSPDTQTGEQVSIEDPELPEENDNLEVFSEVIERRREAVVLAGRGPASSLEYSDESLSNPYLTPEVIALAMDKETKRLDKRAQGGSSPADFGDHKPIPIDTICAVAVVSEEALDLENDLPPKLEKQLDGIIRGHVANFELADTCAFCGLFPEDCQGKRG